MFQYNKVKVNISLSVFFDLLSLKNNQYCEISSVAEISSSTVELLKVYLYKHFLKCHLIKIRYLPTDFYTVRNSKWFFF